jgi:hypothetical protein
VNPTVALWPHRACEGGVLISFLDSALDSHSLNGVIAANAELFTAFISFGKFDFIDRTFEFVS